MKVKFNGRDFKKAIGTAKVINKGAFFTNNIAFYAENNQLVISAMRDDKQAVQAGLDAYIYEGGKFAVDISSILEIYKFSDDTVYMENLENKLILKSGNKKRAIPYMEITEEIDYKAKMIENMENMEEIARINESELLNAINKTSTFAEKPERINGDTPMSVFYFRLDKSRVDTCEGHMGCQCKLKFDFIDKESCFCLPYVINADFKGFMNKKGNASIQILENKKYIAFYVFGKDSSKVIYVTRKIDDKLIPFNTESITGRYEEDNTFVADSLELLSIVNEHKTSKKEFKPITLKCKNNNLYIFGKNTHSISCDKVEDFQMRDSYDWFIHLDPNLFADVLSVLDGKFTAYFRYGKGISNANMMIFKNDTYTLILCPVSANENTEKLMEEYDKLIS